LGNETPSWAIDEHPADEAQIRAIRLEDAVYELITEASLVADEFIERGVPTNAMVLVRRSQPKPGLRGLLRRPDVFTENVLGWDAGECSEIGLWSIVLGTDREFYVSDEAMHRGDGLVALMPNPEPLSHSHFGNRRGVQLMRYRLSRLEADHPPQ
jgi:hypothetical protein